MLKYFISAILLALFTTGCSTKSPEFIKFEEDKLLHDLHTLKNCRIQNTRILDDGQSDIELIATAVIKKCKRVSQHVMNNNMHDKSEAYREKFETQMDSLETSGVLEIVQKHRKTKNLKALKLK